MIKVVKNSGKVVDFDRNKLRNSLIASWAEDFLVEEVIQKIEKEIFEGISTKHIYKLAFKLLREISNCHASRYDLRKGIQMLGPEGFYFEKYVSKLLEAEGYQTKMNLKLMGESVSHEIDVLAKRDESIMMVECKFHYGLEAATDVKVPMYILSRFNDLRKKQHIAFSKTDIVTDCMIITNNRFTTDAITFANYYGIQLIDWNYPPDNSLRARCDDNFLYPVTCLTTIDTTEKQKLLAFDIILAKELLPATDVLEKLGLKPIKIVEVLKEVTDLCKPC